MGFDRRVTAWSSGSTSTPAAINWKFLTGPSRGRRATDRRQVLGARCFWQTQTRESRMGDLAAAF